MRQVITIGREYGSGGRAVAQKVADSLSVPYYDKQIIEMAAKETGLSEAFIMENEQKKTPSFLYNLYISSRNLPVPDQVFVAQTEIIKRLADEGPCVIVGRCANYILQDHKSALHVFVHAPFERRVRRAQEEYGEPADIARMMVARHDKARASYYNHFTAGDWGRAQNYDLSINSELGIDAVVGAILALAKADAEPPFVAELEALEVKE